MTWPFSLFDNANSASRNTSARINKEQIDAFRSLLEQQAAIRLLVGTGAASATSPPRSICCDA
ncbi:hypothetical protein JOS77_22995 [Chromobacterium haemolyticum]|nr:hypothetical protein JOS77_22995 [Chromobacterium haemolyticum]